jgi:transposase
MFNLINLFRSAPAPSPSPPTAKKAKTAPVTRRAGKFVPKAQIQAHASEWKARALAAEAQCQKLAPHATEIERLRDAAREEARKKHKRFKDPTRRRGRPPKLRKVPVWQRRAQLLEGAGVPHELTPANVRRAVEVTGCSHAYFLQRHFSAGRPRIQHVIDNNELPPSRDAIADELWEAKVKAVRALPRLHEASDMTLAEIAVAATKKLRQDRRWADHVVTRFDVSHMLVDKDQGFYQKTERRAVMLTPRHIKIRLAYCRKVLEDLKQARRSGMSEEQYLAQWVFSDETACKEGRSLRRKKVRAVAPTPTKKAKKEAKAKVLKAHYAPMPKVAQHVTMWMAIHVDVIADYDVIDGAMTSEHYCNVLRNVVRLRSMLRAQRPDTRLYFVQDNLRAHTAKAAKSFMERAGIQRFTVNVDDETVEWPPNSPDINPIELFFSHLKRLYAARYQPVYGKSRLMRKCREMMANEDFRADVQAAARACISGWPARLRKCVAAKGELFE